MSLHYKQLNIDDISSSIEIERWLSQFPGSSQPVAKMLLMSLKFISRDTYSNWLLSKIRGLPSGCAYALYSVRKFDNDSQNLWNDDGNISLRPGTSQGSEDLVASLISNIVRGDADAFLDHPGIDDLRRKKVHEIVLIDDSIGSGDRVSGFINSMLKNKTFLSWWSFGFIKIHVISFARTRESVRNIIKSVHGSDHGVRKIRKSDKISFTSEMVYSVAAIEERWGKSSDEITGLCDQKNAIPKWAKRGYGGVLGNLVFYHSVPNNLPGALWFSDRKWEPLFPGRTLPGWLLSLLEETRAASEGLGKRSGVTTDIVNMLALIRRGVRSVPSLALRLNYDDRFAFSLLEKAKIAGLVSMHNRLTRAGLDLLKQSTREKTIFKPDHSLYIPSSWCVGHVSTQPSTSKKSSSPSGIGLDEDIF